MGMFLFFILVKIKVSYKCKNKGNFLQYPMIWTVKNSSCFTPWQACSTKQQLSLSRKHWAELKLLHKNNL